MVFPSENRQQYEDVHKSVWQWVLCLLHDSNVRNYWIYRYGELFVSYME
ncbi:L-rhamnose mutarotase [Salinibacterium xinjiangense]